MNTPIEVAGHGGRIAISIHRYERFNASDTSDANWLAATLNVAIGSFSGDITCSLTTHDLLHLRQDLEELFKDPSRKVEFSPDEEALVFEVSLTRGGVAIVTGKVKGNGPAREMLTFRLESDQTYLQSMLRQVAAVCGQYPPIV